MSAGKRNEHHTVAGGARRRSGNQRDAEAHSNHVDQIALADPVQLYPGFDVPLGHPPRQMVLDIRSQSAGAYDEPLMVQFFELHAARVGQWM